MACFLTHFSSPRSCLRGRRRRSASVEGVKSLFWDRRRGRKDRQSKGGVVFLKFSPPPIHYVRGSLMAFERKSESMETTYSSPSSPPPGKECSTYTAGIIPGALAERKGPKEKSRQGGKSPPLFFADIQSCSLPCTTNPWSIPHGLLKRPPGASVSKLPSTPLLPPLPS